MQTFEDRILKLMSYDDGISGAEIYKALGWWNLLGSIYPALMSLERKYYIYSKWEDGPYPRRRLYYLNRGM